jgi:hypothetical protein
MAEIKFRWVGLNKHFNEIQIQDNLTTDKILNGETLTFFSQSNRGEHDNCKFLSQDLCSNISDVNGKEIYAGDILDKKYKWVVVFADGCFYAKSKIDKSSWKYILLSDLIKKRKRAGVPIEIIGNIHENINVPE